TDQGADQGRGGFQGESVSDMQHQHKQSDSRDNCILDGVAPLLNSRDHKGPDERRRSRHGEESLGTLQSHGEGDNYEGYRHHYEKGDLAINRVEGPGYLSLSQNLSPSYDLVTGFQTRG